MECVIKRVSSRSIFPECVSRVLPTVGGRVSGVCVRVRERARESEQVVVCLYYSMLSSRKSCKLRVNWCCVCLSVCLCMCVWHAPDAEQCVLCNYLELKVHYLEDYKSNNIFTDYMSIAYHSVQTGEIGFLFFWHIRCHHNLTFTHSSQKNLQYYLHYHPEGDGFPF